MHLHGLHWERHSETIKQCVWLNQCIYSCHGLKEAMTRKASRRRQNNINAGAAEGEGLVGPRPHHFFAPPPHFLKIKYYDFIPFFDFQYEKIIFNCQPSHFSPCSAVPVADKTNAPRKYEQLDYKYQTATDLKKTYDPKIRNKLTFKLQRIANEYTAERSLAVLYSVSTSVNLYVKLIRI